MVSNNKQSNCIGWWPADVPKHNRVSTTKSSRTWQAKKAARLVEEALSAKKKRPYQDVTRNDVAASRERGRANYMHSVKARMLADKLLGKEDGK